MSTNPPIGATTVAEDDYLSRSMLVLQDHKIVQDEEELSKFTHDDAFAFEDANVMLQPGYLKIENGWVRRNDGSMFVATLTDIGDTTGEMFDWWFCQCDNTEKYRWWHPNDHKSGTWDASYFDIKPEDRKPGHYIGHKHIVDENVGPELQSLNIEFMNPSAVFDTTKFKENGVTACLVGRVHAYDALLGMVAAGHLIHIVREVNGKSELRSRFFIGDSIQCPDTMNFFVSQFVSLVSGFSAFRILKVPYSFGKYTYIHCAQEMTCLGKFLPHYYHARRKEFEQMKKESK
jgi:hypothetical protein